MKRMVGFWRLILICGWISCGSGRAQPIVIGFTNCAAVSNYSQSMMDRIGQLKWYFTHASVGANMMDGLAALHAANPGFYRLSVIPAGAQPPASCVAGAVYEYDRGNPSWWQKFVDFQTGVSNGWRYPLVNIAMTKLCFIDFNADLHWSLAYLPPLESAYPETLFVHMTIPLTPDQNDENYQRNLFNDGLRAWCLTNNRVLFDIADIESHDTNGAPVGYTYSGQYCQRLYDGYASDQGHLNETGSELAAKGFYALGGALMSADRDGDGLSDGMELVAGTRPGDPRSVFNISSAEATDPGTVVIRWASVSNRLYTLQRGTNLAGTGGFSNLAFDLPATPPLNCYTDSLPSTGPCFYRLQVRQ